MQERPEKRDSVEVWAIRVGRGLGVVVLIVLAVSLLATYWPR